jgi:ankyrin repeat protein
MSSHKLTEIDKQLIEAVLSSGDESTEEVRHLLTKGANANSFIDDHRCSVLYLATRRSYLAKIDPLVRNGADLEKVKHGRTLLAGACIYRQNEAVKLLLSLGADPNLRSTGDELTPLMECVLCSNFTAAAELIKAGANVKLTWKGKSALSIARLYKNEDAIALLTKAVDRHEATSLLNWVLALAPLELPICEIC